jgi:hypothetical protein
MPDFGAALVALFPMLVIVVAEWVNRRRKLQTVETASALFKSLAVRSPASEAAFDILNVRLEQYVRSNLIQVNAIFWLAVSVMCIGFYLIYSGLALAFAARPQVTPALVGAGAGVLTEFIGATFLFIYKSTVAQASGFMSILERAHRIGIAVQLLDEIPETQVDAKAATRAEVIHALLEMPPPPHTEG